MRVVRVVVSLLLVAAMVGVVVLAVGRFAGGGGASGYLVRAVFDNSSFVIPGEEVKVAGVTIGTIHAIDLTPQNKAALVLQITDRQFVPFRADAHCEIGLESLLGEQYVQCTPTQPRMAGVAPPPALAVIGSGPNAGQHLLPVTNTTTPVGIDLLNDIQRLPQQERFRLIISGLGAGLAGNGNELNAALERADPALQETDHVIAVLGSEDHTLAQLTDESARILKPLAAQRRGLGGFFVHAGEVAEAAAQEGPAIEQNFADFPPFLKQFRPAAARLTRLAEQMTPALRELLAQAPANNAALEDLGPLAYRSIPAFRTLGSLAKHGEAIFPHVHTLAEQLNALGKPLQPLATDLGGLFHSFDSAGGIEDLMRFIYFYTGSVNGENSLGHYIRALVEISNCTPRSSQPGGCDATFGSTTVGAGAAQASDASVSTWAPFSHGFHSTLESSNAHPATRSEADARDSTAQLAQTGAATASASGEATLSSARSLLDFLLAR